MLAMAVGTMEPNLSLGSSISYEKTATTATNHVKNFATSSTAQLALEAFYDATDGDTWATNTNWKIAADLNDWFGITATSSTIVTAITSDMHRNCLAGSIPTDIGALTDLTYFSVFQNSIGGTIPTEFGQLPNLQYLSCALNRIHGTMPTEIGALVQLTVLSLRGNCLTGTLPAELTSLTDLVDFHVYVNSLSGTIAGVLSPLTTLNDIRVYFNFFSDSGPAFPSASLFKYDPQNSEEYLGLRALYYATDGDNWVDNTNWNVADDLNTWFAITATSSTSVIRIDDAMRSNSLAGTIPDDVSKLTALEYASFTTNSLTGTMSTSFASSTSLTELSFGDNSLTGSIPAEVTLYTLMQDFSVRDNSLTGSLPSEIGAMTDLTLLYVYGNSLSGIAEHSRHHMPYHNILSYHVISCHIITQAYRYIY
jgi:Leucine-rich repeat (LRR) protein